MYNKRTNNSSAGNALKILEDEFQRLTRHFDLEDWRTVRNEEYWKADEITDKTLKLMHKIKLIRYYDQHGKVKE